MKVEVQAIGPVRLELGTGFCFEIDNVVFVPSMRRNLISISKQVMLNFHFNFNKSGFDVFLKAELVGHGSIVNGLF